MINVENELISYEIKGLLAGLDSSIELDDLENSDRVNGNTTIEEFRELYFLNKPLTNDQVYTIRYDFEFKVHLLQYIQNQMKHIINDSSSLLFKELVNVVNLLSLGNNYQIFKGYNEFSSDGISKLFREYETLLQEQHSNDPKNFEITFNYYLTLIEAYNELCIINSTDIKRKKSIPNLVELITESINLVKFTIPLTEEKLLMLGNIQGKFLFFYSHVLYISTKNKTLKDLIYEYKFTLDKQMDGYFLSSSTKIEEENNYYVTLLANSTTLLLLMLMKFEELEEDVSFEQLGEIIETYKKECKLHFDVDSMNTTEEFKTVLLDNFVHIYHQNLDISYHELINEIIQNKLFTSSNLEILHHIILFNDDISSSEMDNVLNTLLCLEKFKNDYHEYYKLKVIDVIINKMIKLNHYKILDKNVNAILKYIESSNTASHLMSMFSKIFLSLSYYYSLRGSEYLKQSQSMYFIGEKVCNYTLIKDEYEDIYTNVLLNHAKCYLEKFQIKVTLSTQEMIQLSQSQMAEFFLHEEIYVKYNLSNEVSKMIEKILLFNDLEKEQLAKKVSLLISKKIFYGLATCFITKDENGFETFEELGFEIKEVPLIEGYKIIYKYPYSYEQNFDDILCHNLECIQSNLTNLILSYQLKANTDEKFMFYIPQEEE